MSDPPAAEASVVLHAETTRTAVERVAVGAVRIRRVIVTERRAIEVDIAHEELVIEHLDEPPADAGGRHRSPTTEPLVIELHAEQIQLVRTVAPTERITVHVDQVTEDLPVRIDLRREIAETRTVAKGSPQHSPAA